MCKPLGLTTPDWVDYNDYAGHAVVFASDPREFKGVWTDPLNLYLYDDSPESRRDYFSRLERLFGHSAALASRVGRNRRVIEYVAPVESAPAPMAMAPVRAGWPKDHGKRPPTEAAYRVSAKTTTMIGVEQATSSANSSSQVN